MCSCVTLLLILFFEKFFHFMCLGVLPKCMSEWKGGHDYFLKMAFYDRSWIPAASGCRRKVLREVQRATIQGQEFLSSPPHLLLKGSDHYRTRYHCLGGATSPPQPWQGSLRNIWQVLCTQLCVSSNAGKAMSPRWGRQQEDPLRKR